ncbi:MAG: hypothetical protein JO061_00510 [Acidobacteriaceae bacterium]|nr:hypothetical protein [Acidobacteriaceae bacterium]
MNIVDGSAGLAVSDPGVVVNSDGSATITLNNVQNWFLRFLGLYIQFVDPNGDVISYNKLDRGTIFPDPAPPISGLDLPDDSAFFGGILPPPFTIVGVPIVAGNYSVTVTFPKSASTMRLFYGTLGYNGSAPGPLQVKDVGLAVTALVNYALVVFFAAVGASGIDSAVKLIVGTLGQALALELVTGVKDLLSNSPSSPSFLLALALGILRGILNGLAGKALTTLAGLIAQEVAKAVVRNNIPVAGTAARVAAAVIGAAQLAETMIEAGLSPMVYEFDIVRSHDLTLTISPDPNADEFPKLPIGYTLYYKVNYLFDNASPHYLDAVPLTEPYPRSIQVTLPNLPQGGNINISVGFYAQRNGQAPGINDWCAAKGTTGLQENLSNAPRTITIQQFKIPITKDTVYTHKQITTLDSAGNHQWLITSTAPAFVPLTGEQQPGSLGALRSISVRQRTSQHAGYVGYSWQGYSSGLLDCAAGARGQLDQAANLNTDVANAQNGYASTPCGQQGGAASGMKLTYSLLTDDQENFYLDTNSLLIRQVKLSNPPSFGNPSSGNAFGKLNLESTALLLHPAGHLVSINNTNHKLETLKMSSVPLDDQDAATNYRARVASGQGSRPGLMTSPVASAISPEGVILVLEDSGANNRIQAFDLGGNPIQYFKNQPSPYFLELPATQHARYLDFAIEFSGFVYVLSRGRDGVFRLDIYHPGQSDTRPISTSYNVNGAKLCVDFWRTVYTLNYQVLQLPNGSYPALTEPSVSAWLPSLP